MPSKRYRKVSLSKLSKQMSKMPLSSYKIRHTKICVEGETLSPSSTYFTNTT